MADEGYDDIVGMGGVPDSWHAGTGGGAAVTCRYCGEIGHFSRDCPDSGKGGGAGGGGGACFNCGEEGHNKADCPNERVFSGTCRHCGNEGHMARECPDKPAETCKNCGKEGHKIAQCTEARRIDFSGVEDKSATDAWKAVQAADRARDLDDMRDAIMVYVKAVQATTYPELEHAFRRDHMNTHLIASEKEVMDTFTLMDLQGNLDRKYTVGYFLSANAQRAKMKEGWPESAEENMKRLENAGVPVDRGLPKCTNCDKLGHISKSCPDEPRERTDRVQVKCVNCDEVGHRVRDCPKPRKDQFACRNCGQPGHKQDECTEPRSAANVECRHCSQMGHFAKDCPNREPETCRNCGEEGHRSKECTNPRNPAMMKCRNCDEMGHMSKECPKPRDYSRVQCQNCGEMGHTRVRCKAPPMDESGHEDFGPSGHGDYGAGNDSFNAPDADLSADPAIAATDSGEW